MPGAMPMALTMSRICSPSSQVPLPEPVPSSHTPL